MRNNAIGTAIAILLMLLAVALSVAPSIIVTPHSVSVPREGIGTNETPPLTSIELAEDVIKPETMAKSFVHSGLRLPKSEEAAEAPPPPATPSTEPTVADWLRPVGMIADEAGVVRLYLKNTRDGSLVGIRKDGTEEKGIRLVENTNIRYLIAIDGSLYMIPRRVK